MRKESNPMFRYTCSKCGGPATYRREFEAPAQSLGKFRCARHGAVPIRRERVHKAQREGK